jgi:hypothetical protein
VTAGWLKEAVIGMGTPQVSIIQRIKANLGGHTQPRAKDVVHASDATKPNFCPRHWALLDIEKKKIPEEYISTALAATFDVGRATADLVTEHWLGDSAIGNWKCATCGEQRSFCSKPKNGCAKQLGCNWRYKEVVFESKEYGVSGSIDVMVDLGAALVAATELKIIKVEDFAEIKQPLAEHVLRTQMYLKLISDSNSAYKNRINLHEARVFYASRGYGKANLDHNKEVLPFKEFVVKRNDERVVPLLKNAQQVMIFRQTGEMPSGICTLPSDKYAKHCTTCKGCFSGQYPAAQPSLEL